jgi:integrase
MKRACESAGVPHFTVHDLRRRRITVWHHEGVPQKVYMERSGHTRYSVSLDVYTHATPTEEVPYERLQALIAA